MQNGIAKQQPEPTSAPQGYDVRSLLLLQGAGLFERDWFLRCHPDLDGGEVDALAHYHRFGWREGRWPNPYFDPAWYVAEHADVRSAAVDPLWHYAMHGEAEGRRPVRFFDPVWYRLAYGVAEDELALTHFLRHRRGGHVSPIPEFDPVYYLAHSPDVAAAGMDPFEHYLVQGAEEGRRPSAQFDPVYYRVRYLTHVPGENPLLHYRAHRHRPGVFPRRPAGETDIPSEVRRNTAPGPHFEEIAAPLATTPLAKVLAFYLPQFHPCAENDEWWGRGFTEWTNVGRGLPRFAGHYQPRIPRDLGHYRLDDTDTLRRQAELARGAGLHGFVFYFYWFNRRRLLDGPLEALLADPSIELPFCLMWANENWTRRWDGSENEVLISQDYRDEDGAALVAEFLRHFRDKRYIRLGGRPVLMVYRAGLIPDTAATVAGWRAQFRAGGEDPVFVMAQSFQERDPRPLGMDAAVEFPPHKLTEGLARLNPKLAMLDAGASAQVFAYDDVARASDLGPSPYPLIRTAVPSWDNDARRQGAGLVLHGSTPAAYEAWLARLIAAAQPVCGETVVCVNAWNEWAEGAYLEPDVHFGAAYLNATARAIGRAARPVERTLLLVGHDAFPAGAQLLLLSIGRSLRARGVPIAFLLLEGGALEAAYRAVAPVTIGLDALPAAECALVNSCAAAAAGVVLAAAGVRVTLLVHELPRLLAERGLLDVAGAAASRAATVVFAAPFVRDRFCALAKLDPARAVLAPQGLYRPPGEADRAALRARLGVPDGAALAMGLGYADLRKGFDLFLQVCRYLAPHGAHALWIGDIDPTMHAYLRSEMEAAAHFHHLPRQEDAADWFAAADVHLLTSREDPFPTVVLEAMAAGVPTVAFEGAGGAPDVLRMYGAGTSVPLSDAQAMAGAALAAVGSVDRAGLAERARRDFAWDLYVDRLLALVRPARAISVAVPNYNYARYLPARLASVFAQTHPLAEVLVLDDASSDDSAEVLQRAVAGRPIVWLPNAVNSGSVFRQWLRAAERAQAEWLWIAEADDQAEPGLLAALSEALDAAPRAVLAFCDSRAIDADGRPLWPSHQAYYARAGTALLVADAEIPAAVFLNECLASRNLILNASAVLWRRSALLAALRACEGEFATFRMAGDWRVYAELLAQAAAQGGTVAYVAAPLNVHRRHAASVTHALDPARHLDEVGRMQAYMRSVLGDGPALRARQRAALLEMRAALPARPGVTPRARRAPPAPSTLAATPRPRGRAGNTRRAAPHPAPGCEDRR